MHAHKKRYPNTSGCGAPFILLYITVSTRTSKGTCNPKHIVHISARFPDVVNTMAWF